MIGGHNFGSSNKSSRLPISTLPLLAWHSQGRAKIKRVPIFEGSYSLLGLKARPKKCIAAAGSNCSGARPLRPTQPEAYARPCRRQKLTKNPAHNPVTCQYKGRRINVQEINIERSSQFHESLIFFFVNASAKQFLKFSLGVSLPYSYITIKKLIRSLDVI